LDLDNLKVKVLFSTLNADNFIGKIQKGFRRTFEKFR